MKYFFEYVLLCHLMAENLKKREVKIREVHREKIASKLENVMCRCRRAKEEETYVECSSCS